MLLRREWELGDDADDSRAGHTPKHVRDAWRNKLEAQRREMLAYTDSEVGTDGYLRAVAESVNESTPKLSPIAPIAPSKISNQMVEENSILQTWLHSDIDHVSITERLVARSFVKTEQLVRVPALVLEAPASPEINPDRKRKSDNSVERESKRLRTETCEPGIEEQDNFSEMLAQSR